MIRHSTPGAVFTAMVAGLPWLTGDVMETSETGNACSAAEAFVAIARRMPSRTPSRSVRSLFIEWTLLRGCLQTPASCVFLAHDQLNRRQRNDNPHSLQSRYALPKNGPRQQHGG